MTNVHQGFVHGRLATISTHDLVRMQQGPTVHGRLNNERVAFLRAVASGISKADAMERYFHDLPPRERREEAEATIAVARALARRHGDSAAHLIGIDVWALTKTKAPKLGLATAYDRDSFLKYLEEVNPYLALNLADESDEMVREQYLELFPRDEYGEGEDARKENRNSRLVNLYVDAVKRLEKITIDTPSPTHPIKDWLPAPWVTLLEKAGIESLDDLGRRVRLGGRWFSEIEGLRAGMATKVQRYLERLLPGRYTLAQAVTMSEVIEITTEQKHTLPQTIVDSPLQVLSPVSEQTTTLIRGSIGERKSMCLIDAQNDIEAMDLWVQATCNSKPTLRSYLKEGRRFLAWLAFERGGKRLCQTGAEDCLGYLTFLQNIPDAYVSRRRLSKKEAGGLIFRGPLSDASVAQTRTIVSGMFGWLLKVGYIHANPWVVIGKKISRSHTSGPRRSKAFDEQWLTHVLDYLSKEEPSPAKSRLTFVIEFVIRTGLRPSELVQATMGDIERTDEGLFLHVVGKGSKDRWCVINHGAEEAVRRYLRERGLPPLESCSSDIPLVSSTADVTKHVGYQSLHESFTLWLNKIAPSVDGRPLRGNPSLHRLRHTFATQAVKGEIPYDVIQAQLGHANINTTISIYATAPDKRRANELNRL